MRLSPRLLGRRSPYKLPPLSTIGEILKLYQITASKRLSQNFLLDPNMCRKLVNKSGPLKDAFVLEVGPGPGSLTRAILTEGPRKLIVVEKDRRFVPILNELKEAVAFTDRQMGRFEDRMEIIRNDILGTPLVNIFPEEAAVPWESHPPNINVIGNLPFAISTPLLINWLHDMSKRRGIFKYGRVGFTLTFQREVADRMIASIMNVQRCRLSVMCQLYADVQMCFVIPGRMFVPPPDVDVGVVTIRPKVENLIPEVDFLMVTKLVRNLFQFRQKWVKNCLERLFPAEISQDLTYRMLTETGVAHDTKPFYVSNPEIRKLCLVYKEICDEIPLIYRYKHDDPIHLRGPLERDILKQWYEKIGNEDLTLNVLLEEDNVMTELSIDR